MNDERTDRGPSQGELVDQYRITRLVGEGGMGRVYLARDTRLGRKVALKVVSSRKFGDDSTARRFLEEARITATFNHPNIVTVYGTGEYHGNPYVALEYLEGRNLHQLMKEVPVGVLEASRLCLAAARALIEAHSHGVLHRDLKPANVFIPRDGRARVLDFGLAKRVTDVEVEGRKTPVPSGDSALDSSGGVLLGTPMYMAPEQWHSEECTPKTDIWALGVMLYELIEGHRPFEEETPYLLCAKVCSKDLPEPMRARKDLPQDLEDLVAACLSRDPDERPDAEAVAGVLEELVDGGRSRRPEGIQPFRGLLPFSERHRDLFHGRDDEIDAFLERLRDEPVLPVVGPSGAGKSSFVQAGIIPRLREQGRWIVISLRPGRQPFMSLLRRLLKGDGGPSSSLVSSVAKSESGSLPSEQETKDSEALKALSVVKEVVGDPGEDGSERQYMERLLETPGKLAVLLSNLAQREDARVLLFVDQMEELVTHVEDEALRRAFMDAVCAAGDDPGGPVRVIFTLRDDFLSRLADSPAAREAFEGLVVLRRPGESALEEILTRSVAEAGFAYDDPGMVREIIEEVRGEPACLPLIQFACRLLWERRDKTRKLILRDEYEKMGKVAGALARHADGVLESFTARGAKVAREVLTGLVTPEGTRRSVEKGRLLEGMGSEGDEVLKRLARDRIVLLGKSREAEGGSVVDLVHESLIRSWMRLRRWVEEGRLDMAFLRDAEQAAESWKRRGRRREDLWKGDTLAEARVKARRLERVPALVNEFLKEGRQAERSSVRTRRVVVGLAFVVLVVVAAVLAIQNKEARLQRSLALEHQSRAELRQAEALREGASAALERGDYLEARAKLRRSMEIQDSPMGRSLWWSLGFEPISWRWEHGAATTSIAFSPDYGRIAFGRPDGAIFLADVESKSFEVLRGHDDQVISLEFSKDGGRLSSGTWGGKIGVWDLRDHTAHFFGANGGGVTSLSFDSTGERLASSNGAESVIVWDVSQGVKLVEIPSVAKEVIFAGGNDHLYTAGKDGKVQRWVVAEKEPQLEIPVGEPVRAMAVSEKEDLVLAGSPTGKVRLISLKSGKIEKEIAAHQGPVSSVRFSKDGERMISAGYDGAVKIWERGSSEPVMNLDGHTDAVEAMDVSGNGKKIASGGYDETLVLWSPSNQVAGWGREEDGYESTQGVAFQPGGSLVASGGKDKLIHLWDPETGEHLGFLEGHEGSLWELVFSKDGKTLYSSAADGTIRAWDVAKRVQTRVFEGYGGDVTGLALSFDESMIAGGSVDRTARIFDTQTGELVKTFEGHGSLVFGVDFSPDGKTLATASLDKTVGLWDVETGERTGTLQGHEMEVWSARFSPNGKTLASAGYDGTVRLWDLDTKKGRVLGSLEGRAYWVSFSSDGRRVGVSSSAKVAKIWEVETGEALELKGHKGEVNWLRLSGDGARAVTSGDDGTVRLWDANTGEPLWRLGGAIKDPVRILTHRGWSNLKGEEVDPRDVLPLRLLEGLEKVSSQGKGRLCLSYANGEVGIWDEAQGRMGEKVRVDAVKRLFQVGRSCVALTKDRKALFIGPEGEKTLDESTTSVGVYEDTVSLVSDEDVSVFDATGKKLFDHRVGAGLTAANRMGDMLWLGYSEGNVEGRFVADEKAKPTVLEGVPSASVEVIVPGPMNTIVAGFSNGFVGMWTQENGVLLKKASLHGPVAWIGQENGIVTAATDLGDTISWNLRAFDREYCDLMREIWKAIPVVWERGAARKAGPAEGHVCVRGSTRDE